MLADYVGFAPATVSLVINRSEVAENIPQRTKDLIFAAAEKLHYRPNFVARVVTHTADVQHRRHRSRDQ